MYLKGVFASKSSFQILVHGVAGGGVLWSRSQAISNISGPAQVAQAQDGHEPAVSRGSVPRASMRLNISLAQHQPEGAWTGRTRASNKRKAPETGSHVPETAAQQLLPKPQTNEKNIRRRRRKRVLHAHPLLLRKCEHVNMTSRMESAGLIWMSFATRSLRSASLAPVLH